MSKHVHFLGIGGSGMSGVALLAKAQGFEVSGCDKENSTAYSQKLVEHGINVESGHDAAHLENVDILAVTPAAFFEKQNSEIINAQEKGLAMTWQKFLGKYLQKDKKVICVAGTHGKSTTTALLGSVFESAGLDPWVMVGATVPAWSGNARIGKSDIFITESDEFYDNFLNYTPDIIILNNIEFDHPDYFSSEEQMFESFKNFVLQLKGDRVLIYNEDDMGIKKLFELIGKKNLEKLQLYPYSLKDKNIELGKEKTTFEFEEADYSLSIPGSYNVSNALGVIIAANLYKIPTEKIKSALAKFDGIGRRMELLGEKNGIKIYDDYAHHPTAIKATLSAIRQKYPSQKIIAVVEAHSYSRTKALLDHYKGAFDEANEVIIAPIFKARDTETFGITGQSIVEASKHKNISDIDSFDDIVTKIPKIAESGDIVIVMGAGKSYQLAKDIYSKL